jgi:hypothetical protein
MAKTKAMAKIKRATTKAKANPLGHHIAKLDGAMVKKDREKKAK